jgi:hypothetical protein
MVVIEAMAEAEEEAGKKCELERGRHTGSKVRCAATGCKRLLWKRRARGACSQ